MRRDRIIAREPRRPSGLRATPPSRASRPLRSGLLAGALLFSGALLALAAPLPAPTAAIAGKAKIAKPQNASPATSSLDEYLRRVRAENLGEPTSPGSTWSDTGRLARLSSDVRAFQVHDLIAVVVSENLSSETDGTIKGSRASAANSQITALLKAFSPTSAAANILGQSSSNSLDATAQSVHDSTLTTTLGGEVVEVLPNGVLAIEAARQVDFDQETQTIILRGLVRPEDVSANNQVLSTAISDLELEVRGKGILDDYTHRSNFIVRALERLLIF